MDHVAEGLQRGDGWPVVVFDAGMTSPGGTPRATRRPARSVSAAPLWASVQWVSGRPCASSRTSSCLSEAQSQPAVSIGGHSCTSGQWTIG
jgi:hypothetical protein